MCACVEDARHVRHAPLLKMCDVADVAEGERCNGTLCRSVQTVRDICDAVDDVRRRQRVFLCHVTWGLACRQWIGNQ
jgi:hypothetical protein